MGRKKKFYNNLFYSFPMITHVENGKKYWNSVGKGIFSNYYKDLDDEPVWRISSAEPSLTFDEPD